MKYIYIITFYCIFNNTFSQGITFTTEMKSDFSERVFQIIEDDDGNYVYTGLKTYSINASEYNGEIKKLNAQGVIIDSLQISATNPQESLTLLDIIQVGSEYICIGSSPDELSFIKLDKNLNIITRKELTLAAYKEKNSVATAFLMCDSDSNLIVSGGIDSIGTPARRSYLYKINLNGDSIYAIYPHPPFSSFTEVIEQTTDTSYIAFGLIPFGFSLIHIMQHYDVDFNLLNTDTLNNFFGYGTSPIQLEDTIFVAGRSSVINTALLTSFQTLIIKKITTSNDSLNQKIIEGGVLDKETVPAQFDALDMYNNNIFTTGTIRYEAGNVLPFSEKNLAIVVSKTDLDLNILWKEKIYSDSVRYDAYGIIATQDGGCLVYGTIYDWRTQNNQFNTFAIKLDGLGNTSWIKEEPYQQIPITIFPNPAKDFINYKTSSKVSVQKIEIINLEGQTIKDFLSPQTLLNVQDLSQGVYLMRFFTDKGLVVKKMIKE